MPRRFSSNGKDAASPWITCTRGSPANCRSRARENAASSSNRSRVESGLIRRAISRECTPSPGPYSAMTRGTLKSILLATRSTSALELGMMEATCKGRCRNRLKNKALMEVKWLACAPPLSSDMSGEDGVRLGEPYTCKEPLLSAFLRSACAFTQEELTSLQEL